MNGDAEPPQRSSSPLKRRASSMDPEDDDVSSAAAAASLSPGHESADATALPRAMSVDAPELPDQDATLSQRETDCPLQRLYV